MSRIETRRGKGRKIKRGRKVETGRTESTWKGNQPGEEDGEGIFSGRGHGQHVVKPSITLLILVLCMTGAIRSRRIQELIPGQRLYSRPGESASYRPWPRYTGGTNDSPMANPTASGIRSLLLPSEQSACGKQTGDCISDRIEMILNIAASPIHSFHIRTLIFRKQAGIDTGPIARKDAVKPGRNTFKAHVFWKRFADASMDACYSFQRYAAQSAVSFPLC